MTRLPTSAIRVDGGTQTRAEIDLVVVAQYADLLRADAGLKWRDPIVVFYDGADYWLADGFHRVTAAKSVSLPEIDVDVRQGTRRDAILFSVGANAAHGLRRTNADKRRAVETLLRDEEWRGWSDRVVAEKTGTSHPFVAKVRADVAHQAETVTTSGRKGADGKSYSLPVSKPAPEPSALAGVKASELLDDLFEDDRDDEPSPAPVSSPAPAAPASAPRVDTTAFDADARELRKILSEARNLASRLAERGAGLGGVVRAGRLADVRRLVAEALQSLGEVKSAV